MGNTRSLQSARWTDWRVLGSFRLQQEMLVRKRGDLVLSNNVGSTHSGWLWLSVIHNTRVKDLCRVKFSEDPQLFCRPLTGSSDISLCSTIRGSSILSSNIAPTPPLRHPFQVTELLTFSLYSLDLGELRPTELFKFVKSDYQRARGVCGFFCGWACALLASCLRNGWTRQVCILDRLS